MNSSSGNRMICATPEKNPLLISVVITRILELLPLRDIKEFRLICQEWNSVAELLLRKKAKLVFTSKFRTSDYFECHSESRLSALPFTAFKFTDRWDGSGGHLVADLDYFFNKCGKNIKSLELESIHITKNGEDLHRMKAMNIKEVNHIIELLPDHMDKLWISRYHPSTRLPFNLENLGGVKSLSLCRCEVIVNPSNINRIVPSEIVLRDVKFLDASGNRLTRIAVNDFVDFSKCSKIVIETGSDTAISFDMSKDIVDAKKVEFTSIDVINTGFSKIKTDSLSVCELRNPSEAIKMQLKQLDIEFCSPINLTDLSQTIEKLKISSSVCVRDGTVPLDLPNLRYLHFDESTASREGNAQTPFFLLKIISWFKNCSNLVDLHLEDEFGWQWELDTAWLPRSIKRLKLTKISIWFLGDCHPIEVDVLLLDASMNSIAVAMLIKKIKPKTLVKIVAFDKKCLREGSERAEDFISFVRENTQLEKIVISTLFGLLKESSSGKNSFLQFVGEASLWYEFNNQIGKAISEDEFEKYYDINCMTSAE